MSEPDGFLSRWSRRKRAAAEPDPAAEQPFELQDVSGTEGTNDSASRDAGDGPAEDAEKEERPFDLSKLPPIESITAETDIRAFLAPGVPPELTQAALRRVWVMDPKIRDFIEIAENQWDFTVTGGAPGFDLSAPTGDIARMVADIFGKPSPGESPDALGEKTATKSASAKETLDHRVVNEPPQDAAPEKIADPNFDSPATTVIAQQSPGDSAMQKDDATQRNDAERFRSRSHGRAVPR
jgi:hypothetical protein